MIESWVLQRNRHELSTPHLAKRAELKLKADRIRRKREFFDGLHVIRFEPYVELNARAHGRRVEHSPTAVGLHA